MHHLTCHCNIKQEEIADAIKHTLDWIPVLQEKYDEPIVYEAFQDVQSQNLITYFITHSDQQAERQIASMDEPRKFGETLYKMCVDDPKWVEHNLVNSIRNHNRQSSIFSRVEYKVKESAIGNVKAAICNYIDKVRDTESGIHVYESYQSREERTKFTHLAHFKDKDSEQCHKDQKHTKKFIEFLYPLCDIEPKFIYMNLLGSVKR